jgi:hypothetical protein
VRSYLKKKKITKKRAGGATQGIGPEFKPQVQNKQTNKQEKIIHPYVFFKESHFRVKCIIDAVCKSKLICIYIYICMFSWA